MEVKINERELIWKIRDIICSKCDGSSYDCYTCDTDEKLTRVLSIYDIEEIERVKDNIYWKG